MPIARQTVTKDGFSITRAIDGATLAYTREDVLALRQQMPAAQVLPYLRAEIAAFLGLAAAGQVTLDIDTAGDTKTVTIQVTP